MEGGWQQVDVGQVHADCDWCVNFMHPAFWRWLLLANAMQHFGMFPFRKLAVWRRAHSLSLATHEVTERVYVGRYASLINQMRRASMSIAANIAEGSGQATKPQFERYLTIALGSARKLDYHAMLAKDLGLLPLTDYARLEARIDQVCRMIAVLRVRVLQDVEKTTRRSMPSRDQSDF
jgi:four helix bundle protein